MFHIIRNRVKGNTFLIWEEKRRKESCIKIKTRKNKPRLKKKVKYITVKYSN